MLKVKTIIEHIWTHCRVQIVLGLYFWESEKIFSLLLMKLMEIWGGFPGGSDCKLFACNVEDLGSIPGLGRSPGEGNGNLLQYSCLENSMGWEAW